MASAIALKQDELDSTSDALRLDMLYKKKEYEVHEQELQERLDRLSAGSESAQSVAKLELERLRAEFQKELEQARVEGVEMVQRLTKEHESRIAAVYGQQSIELEKLREKLSISHKEHTNDLRSKHKLEMDAASARHTEQVLALNTAHEKNYLQVERGSRIRRKNIRKYQEGG